MKKITSVLAIICLAILWNSCEVERPAKYFDVNGNRQTINYAYADTWGVSGDLTSRWYAVSFRSQEIEPENFITFFMGSLTNETDIIAEGSYDYNYLSDRGFISDISVGYDIAYDYLGYPSGTRFDDEVADFTGTIAVFQDGTGYRFVFDLEAEYEGNIYTITGEYNGNVIFNADVVDLDSY